MGQSGPSGGLKEEPVDGKEIVYSYHNGLSRIKINLSVSKVFGGVVEMIWVRVPGGCTRSGGGRADVRRRGCC